MLNKVKGVVLHRTKYSDSSLIAKIYTDTFGLHSYIVRGVRSRKSKIKAGLIQPFSLVDMVVRHKEQRNLQEISELRCEYPLMSLSSNIFKQSIALFLAEVTSKCLPEEEHDPDLFHFIANSAKILDLEESGVNNFHLLYLVKFARYLGFYPSAQLSDPGKYFDLKEGTFGNHQPLNGYFINEQLSAHLWDLLGMNFDQIGAIKITGSDRKKLLDKLILFYQIHSYGLREIKSYKVLETVMN